GCQSHWLLKDTASMNVCMCVCVWVCVCVCVCACVLVMWEWCHVDILWRVSVSVSVCLCVCVRECVCVCVCLCVGERAIISLSVFTPVMSFLTQKITGHMVQSGLAAAC